MEYKELSDAELSSIMVNYISRTAHLRDMVSGYLDSHGTGPIVAAQIRQVYKQLKDELGEIAHYLDLSRNRSGSDLYMYYFSPSIREAAAWGFTARSNATINQQFFGAVADAHYKLTKYYSLEEWGNLM